MKRCHDGETYIVPAGPPKTVAGHIVQPVTELQEVAVCCAACHAVLITGPRTEVYADL